MKGRTLEEILEPQADGQPIELVACLQSDASGFCKLDGEREFTDAILAIPHYFQSRYGFGTDLILIRFSPDTDWQAWSGNWNDGELPSSTEAQCKS